MTDEFQSKRPFSHLCTAICSSLPLRRNRGTKPSSSTADFLHLPPVLQRQIIENGERQWCPIHQGAMAGEGRKFNEITDHEVVVLILSRLSTSRSWAL